MDLRQREGKEIGTGLQSVGQAIANIIRYVSRWSFYPRERNYKWYLESLIQDIKIIRSAKNIKEEY